MAVLTIIKAIFVFVVSAVSTLIPCLIAIYKAIKAKKEAKTEADKQNAINNMLVAVNGFIGTAEEMYKGIDAILKSQGSTSGTVKKETVMTKLQAFALSNGYDFDTDYWSKKIDEIVALTRKVNAR